MDLPVLQLICEELADILPGGFVNKIHQPFSREIVLRVRVPRDGEHKIILSADPRMGRIHVTKLRIPNPPRPPRFCAFLRAHFQGAWITSVESDPNDRVVSIHVARGGEADRIERTLVLELLGRDSNILLVDRPTNVIMDCLHRIPQKETTTRVVLPNWHYEPPPKRDSAGVISLWSMDKVTICPGITTDNRGRRKLVVNASKEDEVFSSMNEAAQALYDGGLQSDLVESFRRELAAPLQQKVRALKRRIGKIEEDQRRLARFHALQEDGELLKANLHRAKKGLARLEVEDWNTGQSRIISLNPALSAVDNMQHIFAKAAKGRRGESIVQERLQQAHREKAALDDLLFLVEEARNATELEALASEIPTRSRAPRQQPSEPKDNTKTDGLQTLYRTFRTPDGLTVLVGRSGRGNDYLLREKAAKQDLWFHIKGYPGAHVLLQVRNRESASETDIAYTASLAVRFSRAKGKGKMEVMIAEAGDVSRIKGALPGQVSVRRYRTITAESGQLDE